jgi:hypothetical protein
VNCEQDCEVCERLPQCGKQAAFEYRNGLGVAQPVPPEDFSIVKLCEYRALERRVEVIESILSRFADTIIEATEEER